MNIWVISMWAIAAVLACVSFSLFVRWISEACARLRKHLVSQRSTRSFLLALALILLSAGASLFAGLMAVHLEDLFTERNEQWTTPIALIAGGVVILGLFLIIMGSIGDRARGRTRCPGCWYDMRDAPKLQCPNAGIPPRAQPSSPNLVACAGRSLWGWCWRLRAHTPSR